jgi:3-phenylpropionate/cinnamic acid dioxygenase small subunit
MEGVMTNPSEVADDASAIQQFVNVPMRDPVYADVLEFLYAEAELLDEDKFRAWIELLTDDVTYRMPVRMTVDDTYRGDTAGSTMFFDDDRASLELRVKHMESPNNWSERPASRTRRYVTNVRVEQSGDEFKAHCSVLVLRSRWDVRDFDFISMRRHDVVRRVGGALKLAAREILLDQTNVNSPNLPILF